MYINIVNFEKSGFQFDKSDIFSQIFTKKTQLSDHLVGVEIRCHLCLLYRAYT